MSLFSFVNMEGVQPEIQNVTFLFLKNPKRGKDEIRVAIKIHIICISVDLLLIEFAIFLIEFAMILPECAIMCDSLL